MAFVTVPVGEPQVKYPQTNFHDWIFLHAEEHKEKNDRLCLTCRKEHFSVKMLFNHILYPNMPYLNIYDMD